MVLLRHLFLQLIRLNFVFLALRLKKLLLLKKILLCSVSLDLSQRNSAKVITLDLVHSSTSVTKLRELYSTIILLQSLIPGVMLKIVATLPQLQLQILTMVVLEMRLYHQPLNMVSPLMFLDPNVRSVNSLKLLEETAVIDRPSLSSLVDLCLVLVVLPRLLYGRHLKKPSFSRCAVVQLRSTLRIMLDLDSSNIQRILLWHQMLLSDSVLTGELVIFLELHLFMVLLTLHSRVLMYLRVYSPECTPTIRVKNGSDIVHRHAMLTLSTVRLVDLHSSMVMVELVRSAYSVTMVMTEILEHQVHCSDSVVEQNPEVLHLH